MKMSYWKTMAIAIFAGGTLAGTLGGCGDTARIEELEAQVAAVTKERDDLISERDLLKGDTTQLRNELMAAQTGYEADTEELSEYQKLGRPEQLMRKPE